MKDFQFNDISETLLIPLHARSIESKSNNPILIDKKAIEITDQLDPIFSKSKSKLHRNLSKGKLRKKLDVTLSMRTKKFDKYVLEFLKKSPDGIVIEIGCGLSTRFERIDNGKVLWYDLDFPEVIKIRRNFFKKNERYHFIESSVLDFNWMNKIEDKQNKDILLLAEGVFMYLFENDVKNLILKLQMTFPGCELAFEVCNSYVVKLLKRKIWRRKFQRDFHFGEDVVFNWGIREGNELEKWNKNIKFLDEWTYFDDNEKKLGWMRYFGRFKKFRKTQWVVHYNL